MVWCVVASIPLASPHALPLPLADPRLGVCAKAGETGSAAADVVDANATGPWQERRLGVVESWSSSNDTAANLQNRYQVDRVYVHSMCTTA